LQGGAAPPVAQRPPGRRGRSQRFTETLTEKSWHHGIALDAPDQVHEALRCLDAMDVMTMADLEGHTREAFLGLTGKMRRHLGVVLIDEAA
jgi:hypothetical protein